MLKGKLVDGKTQMYEVDWFEPHDQEIEATVTDVDRFPASLEK